MFEKKHNGHEVRDLEEGVDIAIADYEALLNKNGYHPWYRANGQYIWAKNSNRKKDKFYVVMGDPIVFDDNYQQQVIRVKEIKDADLVERIKKMDPELEHSDIVVTPTPIPEHSELYEAIMDHIIPP